MNCSAADADQTPQMDTDSNAGLASVLASMLRSHEGVSDLLFVAGKPPQVEAHGKLQSMASDGSSTALDSLRIEHLARSIHERQCAVGKRPG